MNRLSLGLIQLDVAEPLSDDNFSFQHVNPRLVNYYLSRALDPRFDAAAGLANPTEALTGAVLAGTGQVPANTSMYFGYTLVDARGGETEIIAPPLALTTGPPLADPTTAPTAVADFTAGTLLAGDYSYAVTLTDGQGGETAIGPAVTVTVPSGEATARVMLTGLAAILAADPGAIHWRVYRIQDGGAYHFLNEGTGDALTDDGSFAVQCIDPPAIGTTQATSAFQLTVPGGQAAGAVSANLYASIDGSFQDPALLQNVLAANFGLPVTLNSIVLNDGSPPTVNTSLTNRAKIDPDTEIDGAFRRPVANAAALPALGNSDGDIREALDTHLLWVWNANAAPAAWQPLNSGAPDDDVLDATSSVAWKDYSMPGAPDAAYLGIDTTLTWPTVDVNDNFVGEAIATVQGNYAIEPSNAALEEVAAGLQATNAQVNASWAALRDVLTPDETQDTLEATLNSAGWGDVGIAWKHGNLWVIGRITETNRVQICAYNGADLPPTDADLTVAVDYAVTTNFAVGAKVQLIGQWIGGSFSLAVNVWNTGTSAWDANGSAASAASDLGAAFVAGIPIGQNVTVGLYGRQTTYAALTMTRFEMDRPKRERRLRVTLFGGDGTSTDTVLATGPNT